MGWSSTNPSFSGLKTWINRVSTVPLRPHSEARHPPPAPEPSRRPAGPVPNRAASRPCAGHRVRCCSRGIRRALALPVSLPLSTVAPRSRCPGCSLLPLPRKLTEQQRGGGARSPGESADPAHPARHPRETPSGAAGELRALGREGPAAPGAPGALGAHRCGALGSRRVLPGSPPASLAWTPGAVGGRLWGRERDRAGSGKGES